MSRVTLLDAHWSAISFTRAIQATGLFLALASLAGALPSAIASTNALTPAEELASFRLADPQLKVELVASEPDVLSPVAMAFDADGRLFVAEMIDYPTGPTGGRIRFLEDRDGDGRYETATVFADSLPFPNSVLPWNGGVLVTAAPNLWFLKDTNGDGRADERRILFTGFAAGNQQLRANGLTWGLDNWVYGANGRSDGEIRGGSLPKPISIRGHDFRFRPATGEFEVIAGRSQFGLARDDWGNRFLSWNTIPIRHEVLPERYLSRNPNLPSTESLLDIAPPGDGGRVFPLTAPPLTFNNESVKNFNALAGLTIFRGDALGEAYRGNAFMGESLLNLVHRRVLESNGVTFVARRGELEKEFLASTDPWFHPVNFATGPDGALYVVDFYRRFVEHPDFVRGKAREEVPWRTGAEHGRIWRIRSRLIEPRPTAVPFGRASLLSLCMYLANENGWLRDTAQRLLIERKASGGIISKLTRMTWAPHPSSQVHALYTLDGLNALTPEILLTAMGDSDSRVREHAVRLSERFISATASPNRQRDLLRATIGSLAMDSDPRVRFQVALTLGELSTNSQALAELARRDFSSRWHTTAILSSIGGDSWRLLKSVVQADPGWLNSPSVGQVAFLDQVARLIGTKHSEADLSECLTLLTRAAPGSSVDGRLALLAGLADGLTRSSQTLRQLIDHPPPPLTNQIEGLRQLVNAAVQIAAAPDETIANRLLAVRVLGRVNPETSRKTIVGLLQPDQPGEIQNAASAAVGGLNDHSLTKDVVARWREYAPATRRRLLKVLSQSETGVVALTDALEQEQVAPVELDASVRQSLLQRSDPQLKQRLNRFLQTVSDREEVVRRYELTLKLDGDRQRGAAIFAKACLLCHMVEGQGRQVGPDLSAIASRPRDALLVDIFDPSRQVSPDFINYTVTTTDGKTVTGFIVSETAASVTLRRPGEPDETVLRRQIKDLRAEGKSPMPEGLEQGLTPQDVADLLSFLQKPEARLLPAAPQ